MFFVPRTRLVPPVSNAFCRAAGFPSSVFVGAMASEMMLAARVALTLVWGSIGAASMTWPTNRSRSRCSWRRYQ